jgi:hypothetical protein
MSNKILSTGKIILAVLFLICPAPSRADAEEPRLYRLPWTGDRNALHYEVVIEKEENGRYQELHREYTENSFLIVSLFPGDYRFSVIPYNLLNRPVGRTEWMPFRIPAAPTSEQAVLSPDEPETAVENIVIIDTPEKTSTENAVPVNNKQPDFYAGAAYVNLHPVYGDLKTSYLGLRFKVDTLPVVSIPLTSGFFNLRTEMAATWFYIGDPFAETEPASQMMILEPSLLFQIQFPRIVISPLIVGMGLSMLSGGQSEDQSGIAVQVSLGISLLVLPSERSFFEFGIDFSHLFGWSSGGLRPWIGFGIRS